ncbi:MAG: hypothetical protein AB1611_10395 [bacterium]
MKRLLIVMRMDTLNYSWGGGEQWMFGCSYATTMDSNEGSGGQHLGCNISIVKKVRKGYTIQ